MDKYVGEPSLSMFETSLGRVCQEGLACEQGAGADYYCEDCTTYQCTKCETLLHSTRELKAHTRNSLHGGAGEQLRTTSRGRESAAIKSSPTSVSIPLVNEQEELMVSDKADFVRRLGCSSDCKVKVVSIFGNTGDGKSHTLNHTFFDGEEVFSTSPSQSSCTIGVWVAYSPQYGAIFIDSEGLLGVSKNEHRRTRLLLKVLAVSDVVIYRTRAERLHNDLFTFLGDASSAYWKYFSPELKAASDKCSLDVPLSSLGPSVVIFHETLYTELLGEHSKLNSEPSDWIESGSPDKKPSIFDVSDEEDPNDSPPKFFSTDDGQSNQRRAELRRPALQMTAEELLRIRFSELGYIPKAFSSVEYVGTRTQTPPTDFSGLCATVKGLINNNTVRSPRRPQIVYSALKVLNDKFSGNISNIKVSTFPDAYFTCPEKCLSCGARCDLSMNHLKDGVPHQISGARCKYSHTFDNKVYLCKSCFDRGVESVVTPETSSSGESGWMGLAKYAWAGYVIECPHCGVIYRSRQHWYGNEDPEATAVKTDNKHVWPQDLPASGPGSENVVRRLLDRVGNVAEVVGNVSAQPTKTLTNWMSDQIAPKYWTPNSRILACGECSKEFGPSDTKHHCRACGGGFCEKCSSKYMSVPWRGWGNVPVRVCLSCYKQAQESKTQNRHRTHQEKSSQSQLAEKAGTEGTVTARYVGEVVQSAFGLVAGAMSYPKGVIVESARPNYWVPDSKIKSCHKCKREFGPSDSKHHCRACGEGFCGRCSTHQIPVPSRGWDYPVRVCDLCVSRTDL